MRPLPLDRRGLESEKIRSVTYGDYFTTIKSGLGLDHVSVLLKTAAAYSFSMEDPAKIDAVDIFAVKHGAFYHPARIVIKLSGGSSFSLVLNVAVSVAGRDIIHNEYRLLNYISQASDHVPKVYGFCPANRAKGVHWPMFLGQWFSGFHEFHWTETELDGFQMMVWDTQKGPRLLDDQQTQTLFQKIAFILTDLYDPMTFKQIFPWHHASGDFVVNIDKKGFAVKLITVRGFKPLFEQPTGQPNSDARVILDALLIFFLHLTIRMRLDRIDGTGALVWADDTALLGTWDGFFAGLSAKPKPAALPLPISDAFAYLLATTPKKDLHTLCLAITNRIYSKKAEFKVIRQHLRDHISFLCQLIKTLGFA